MEANRILLSESWKKKLISEFEKSYMLKLRAFLVQEIRLKKCIYPSPREYFLAFNAVSFEKVKVVILGQDPYHGLGQAHGLSFSVRPPTRIPPSLRNIFKELEADIGIVKPKNGCLTSWANQGVLLLNTTLTVEAGKAGSHQNRGWEIFTDRVISLLNKERKDLVFMLWGSFAQNKAVFVDQKKHLILKAPHPSPFSADRGFFGCAHFSKANAYLKTRGKKEINWNIPDLPDIGTKV